jgi:hypothetical protein
MSYLYVPLLEHLSMWQIIASSVVFCCVVFGCFLLYAYSRDQESDVLVLGVRDVIPVIDPDKTLEQNFVAYLVATIACESISLHRIIDVLWTRKRELVVQFVSHAYTDADQRATAEQRLTEQILVHLDTAKQHCYAQHEHRTNSTSTTVHP